MTKIELACPRIHGFVYQIENVDKFIFGPLYKLIVYTLPSIWYYPLSQNDAKIPVNTKNMKNQEIGIVCIELPIVFVVFVCVYDVFALFTRCG